jgi:hypothetical protein
MRGAIPPLHQYVFMAWCRNKFTFTFLLYSRVYVFGLSKNLGIMKEIMSRSRIKLHVLCYQLQKDEGLWEDLSNDDNRP